MMVKLPNGKANKHVTASNGADKGIMDFYLTEYSSQHGQDGFLPRIGKHTGTGYKSNFRPGVYYSRKLDERDNPVMGKMLKDNYKTSMQESFRQYEGSDGTFPFAEDISNWNTGFTSNHATAKSAPPSLTGRREKAHVSESHSQFQQKDPLVNSSGKSIGCRKEESGFTHAKNVEPVTFHPDECYKNTSPTSMMRETGLSLTKTSFLPSQLPRGDEKFQAISLNADEDNGFTRFIRPTAELTGSKKDTYTRLCDLNPIVQKKITKQDPCEHLNLLHPYPYKSMKQAVFQGKQIPADAIIRAKMNGVQISEKEGTGYSSNNKGVSCLPNDIIQASTVYTDEYYNKNLSKSRDNVFKGGASTPTQNGYTKNEKMHTSAQRKQTICKDVRPFVSRSLKARDPFYGEQIHEHKKILKIC